MGTTTEQSKYKSRIITIPNILSFIRICLVPIIILIYADKQNYLMTGILVIISGITDVVDGWIARRFNMISDLGKVLDPVADKSTQIVVALLLVTRFHLMLLPLIIGVIKEIFMAISGYLVVKRCGVVLCAEWHGKMATVMVALTMVLHLLWYEIPVTISTVTIVLSSVSIVLSLVLYAVRNGSYLTAEHKNAT
ncbi:MAG: CDP-alcohol phosphatidyltransferase family protein [Clostridia bacterium]|nr:CDP-alcohol phosphatidyltransferase family protein [Clostridia bacterium]